MGSKQGGDDVILQGLEELPQWELRNGSIIRDLALDDSQHAELAERIRIVADTFGLNATIDRSPGNTQVAVCTSPLPGENVVTFAGRVESAYIAVVGANLAQRPVDEAAKAHWWAKLMPQRADKKLAPLPYP
ncbi:hypothetical protein [Salininema proteolyticum]|uniref:Uncharacterized protein n=1 Tax=Salininema proteolyticum TaxID=1607685 RepID=A0ABV8TT69_9ACTN